MSNLTNKKIITDETKTIENNYVLAATNINQQIKNTQNIKKNFNMNELYGDFTYEYKIVVMGAAGATVELVKIKKEY